MAAPELYGEETRVFAVTTSRALVHLRAKGARPGQLIMVIDPGSL